MTDPELDRTAAHARAYREQSQMWQARAERAEAAIQRVRELANWWSFLEDEDVTVDELRDQLLAALDSTDPGGQLDAPAPIRSVIVSEDEYGLKIDPAPDAPAPTRSGEEKPFIGDFNDPPCGTCGCMRHFCAADCDCCPEHRSVAGLPADGETA